MEMDLSPRTAQKIFEGEGGSYYSWTAGSQSPPSILAEAKVGAGKLVLHPRGFALPHYSDSAKTGYVLQGSEGIAGMVLPNSTKEEVVLKLKKGDVIPVPLGAISWWYNNSNAGDNSDLVVVFLGETSKSYVPGEFTYFLLTGGHGVLSGFSTEFVSRAYGMDEKQANELAKSQTGVLIIKVGEGTSKSMPQPHNRDEKMVYNIIDDDGADTVVVEGAGTLKSLTAANNKFPFLERVGLSFKQVTLEGNAMQAPTCTVDASAQVLYVAQGSGRVQIVGINGKRVLDAQVEAGHLLVIPPFFAFAVIAKAEGIQCLSIITTTRPAIDELAGKKSVWNSLSPNVLEVAFGVAPELVQVLESNIKKSTILIPPSLSERK